MKAALISIQPKWCKLIASGKKTVEVRKTRPKIDVPFKVYIYCTNTKPYLVWGDVFRGSWETEFTTISGYNRKDAEEIWEVFNGKVIGEFVCDEIQPYNENALFLGLDEISCSEIEEKSCVDLDDLLSYKGERKYIYGWHISDLVIYDEPKELSEFWSADKCPYASKEGCTYQYHCFRAGQTKRCGNILSRPPQSWCYVESQ